MGFFKGVGKGLVGFVCAPSSFGIAEADVRRSVVTKPAVGLFDLATNVTEGIRNTTTVFDQSSIDRVRLPRFTASDGILRVSVARRLNKESMLTPSAQPYQEREALGQNWLKNVETGKYFDETYVAHLDIPSSEDSLVVLLTTTRILLVKILKLKVGWDVPLSDLQTISLEPTGISAFSFLTSPSRTDCRCSSPRPARRRLGSVPCHPRSVGSIMALPTPRADSHGVRSGSPTLALSALIANTLPSQP